MEVPSRDCTPRALSRVSRSGRHVGLWPPRNDKSESFTPQNAYRKSCQSAWRSASALYRGIKPQEGTGAPRAPLTCHCEERSDVAISQYPAASWGSLRRNRSCLPEIATSAFGLLAMTSLGALHIRRKYLQICSCQRRSLSAATDAIGAYRFHGGRYGSAALRREGTARPLQWRVQSPRVPGNLQLPKAVTTRKGYAASVRRQSRQRLRSDRRYRRNWCVPF